MKVAVRYSSIVLLSWLICLSFFPINAAHAAASATEVDRILAVVNDNVITKTDLEAEKHTVTQQMRQQNIEIPPNDVLNQQLLERLILKRLQLQLADASGIKVDDDTLNRAIETIAKQNNMSLKEFRGVLEHDGFDFAAFRENIRTEIVLSRLRQRQIANRITVTEQEVENLLATQKLQGDTGGGDSEYHIAQILIALPEAPTPEQVQTANKKAEEVLAKLRAGADFKQTASAVSNDQQALQGGDLGWLKTGQLPTLFAEVVPAMKPGDVSDLIRSASGFHIVTLLDKRGGAQGGRIVKQSQVRHILVRTNELVSDKEAETRLAQLKLRIEGGEDFASLARSHSDDAASSVNGGSLGWVNPGDLAPRFEEVMNSLQPGQISAPFQTQFGWHIVQLIDRRDHDNTEEFRRSSARELIMQRKTEEETQAWLRSLRDEAYVEYKTEE
ncbi:MAG: peptidylprolyl isomerase [Gammaproteobacteria bacterium]|nr:peptidylprolyl isomerase [Gammaproteobacteria bacterium]